MKKRIAFVCILLVLVVGITQCNYKYNYNWRYAGMLKKITTDIPNCDTINRVELGYSRHVPDTYTSISVHCPPLPDDQINQMVRDIAKRVDIYVTAEVAEEDLPFDYKHLTLSVYVGDGKVVTAGRVLVEGQDGESAFQWRFGEITQRKAIANTGYYTD